MCEQNEKRETEIIDVSSEGQGIARVDGMAVFLDGGVPGDKVKIEITKKKKTYAFGKILEILEPSVDRKEAECQYAETCGGCSMLSMTYEAGLRLKEKQVRDKLERIGGIDNASIRPIAQMDEPWNYRNKAQYGINCGGIITKKGGIIENLGECRVGFYRQGSKDLLDIDNCLIQAEPATAAANALRQFMEEDNITAYDPKWERGLMRQLIVKTAFGTGEVMVMLVINGNGVPNAEKLVTMLDEAIDGLNVYDEAYADEIENGVEIGQELN